MDKKAYILLFFLAFSSIANAKTITVAVIDTGFGYGKKWDSKKLCKFGHKDFTDQNEYLDLPGMVNPVPKDKHGHGTNIAGGIVKYAKNVNYCLVILKFYIDGAHGSENLRRSNKAFQYAINIKADVVNYSGGGVDYSGEEKRLIKKFLDNGGLLVTAAGNESKNLDTGNTFYPAMYDDRIIVVGNGTSIKDHVPSSNYGKAINRWEVGTVDAYGIMLQGTSQSTAIATGKILNERFGKPKRSGNRNVVGQ